MYLIRSIRAYLYLRWIRKPWSRVARAFLEDDNGKIPPVVTITDVRNFLNTVVWTKDKWFDYISYPSYILRTKQGDCDDYAVLACTLLDKIKINGSILSVIVEDKKRSHAVCVFWYENDLHMFDNNRFKTQPAGARTIANVIDRVARGSRVLAWSMEDCRGNIARVHRGG